MHEPPPAPRFLPLSGIHEPSAIHQLEDGRFLVLEDERERPFSLFSLDSDGTVRSQALSPGWFDDDAFWKLADLEGLTGDRLGRLYAVTSHSRNSAGDEKAAREKLVRFRVQGDRVVDTCVVRGLKPALLAAHPVLTAAAAATDVKGGGGLNIEALEMRPDQSQLLLGLRGPLLGGQALIAAIDDPDAVFAREALRIDPRLIRLDLDGNGIRGLCHLPALDSYLIIAGPADRAPVPFRLWLWSGRPEAAPRRVDIPGLPGLAHAEGACAAVLGGAPRIVMVSDDGDRATGRCAHYLVLAHEDLRVETGGSGPALA